MSDATYRHIVEEAQRLFAQKGVTNTTVNDIAVASGKGRRTIYTYFNNKHEIYQAVVATEANRMYDRLLAVVNKEMPPSEKFENYIEARLECIREVVERNGSLRAEFFHDIWEVERARKKMSIHELDLLKRILDEGVSKGVFIVHDTTVAAFILHSALKGLDVPYILNHFAKAGVERTRMRNLIADFLLYGIMK